MDKRKILNRCLMGLLAMPLAVMLVPITADAAGTKTTLDISNGTIHIGAGTVDGYDSSGNHITTADSDGYIITGYSNDNSMSKQVSVTEGTHDIVLSGLTIYNRYESQSSAFYIADGATANITLDGANVLVGYACGLFVPEGATVSITGDDSDTLRASADQVGAGIGGRKATFTSYAYTDCGTISIYGGIITAKGGQLAAGIGGGEYGRGGTINIYGGTVTATAGGAGIGGGYGCEASMDKLMITGGSITGNVGKAPVNASNQSVFLTTITLPTAVAAKVETMTVKQGGSTVPYGITGMKTDATGKLNLYLPASASKTTADLTVGGVTYSYSGTVSASSTNSLKLDQALFNVSVNSSYVYGETISPTTSGGTLTGTPALTYSGTDGVTGATLTNSPTKPSNVGSYTVTAVLPGNSIYNNATASANFTITKKNIIGFSVGNINDQTYTGTAVVPVVSVKDTSKNITLVSGTDYTVTCADVNAGSATSLISGNGNYTGSVSKTFNIIQKNMTVSLTASPPTTAKVDDSVTLTAEILGAMNLPEGTVTFKYGETVISSNAVISENDGNYSAVATWSSVPVGSYNITAVYNSAANDNHNCTSNGAISAYSITKYDQPGFGIINGTDYEISGGAISKTYDDAAFTLQVSGKLSEGTVTCTSGDPNIASVNTAGNVTLLKSGTVTITVQSPTDDRYNAATATVTLHISKASQTNFSVFDGEDYDISGGTISKTYGDAPFTLEVTGKLSAGTVTYLSSDTGIAAVDSTGHVTLLKSGTVTLTVNSQADDKYNTAAATVGLNVSKANQTSFSIVNGTDYEISGGTVSKTFGDASFTLQVAGKLSENAVTYASSDSGIASVSSTGSVTILKSGTVTFTANSPTDDRYNNATATVTLHVSKAAQTGFGIADGEDYVISGGTVNKTYTDASFILQITGKLSEVAVTYASSDSGIASVNSAGRVTILKSGTVTLTAQSPADDRYNAATATVMLHVSKAAQTGFSITGSGDYDISDGTIVKTYADSPFTLKVTGKLSTSAVTYSVTSGNDVISVDAVSGQVSLLKSGTAVITATSLTDERYNEANASVTVQVAKAEQSGFTFAESSINKTYGDAPFVVPVSGGQSTGEVTYAVTDGLSILSVDKTSGQVTVRKSGTAVITATKQTDDYYLSATSQVSIHVEKADQNGFRFTDSTINKTYGDVPFVTLLSGKLSSAQVTYAVTNGSDVATVDAASGQVTILKSGTAVITVKSLADDRYNEAAAQMTIHVAKADQKDFGFAESLISKVYGDIPFVISVLSGQSNGGITYAVTDGSDVAQIDEGSGQVTLLKPGTAIVTALSHMDDRYNEATSQMTIQVAKAQQSGFGFVKSSISKTYGDAPFSILASGGQSNGTVTYSVTSGGKVVAVDTQTGQITIRAAGKADITATKAGDDGYNSAISTLSINVGKAATSVTTPPTAADITVIGALSASALSGGEGSVPGSFNWTSPDRIVSATGTYEVTLTPDDSENYTASTCEVKVQVIPVISHNGTGIVLDLSKTTLPTGISSVTIALSTQPATDATDSSFAKVSTIVNADPNYSGQVLAVYDLILLDQNGNQITDYNGAITVRIPIPEGMSGDLRVLWYDSATNATTDMNARIEDGCLVFETTHMNDYAIVKMSEVSASSVTIPNPDTGDKTLLIVLLTLLGIVLAGGIVVAIRMKNKR